MSSYHCIVHECFGNKVVSTEKKAIFRHYLTHLISDLEDALSRLGIVTFHDNRYSIINALIEFSEVRVNENV